MFQTLPPNPLPTTIPSGTKFMSGADMYELISIGVLKTLTSFFGPIAVYHADVRQLSNGQNVTGYNVYSHAIDWDSFNIPVNHLNELDVDSCKNNEKESKHCLWCNELLGFNQNSEFCEVGKVYCKDYYFALKSRMKLDFRQPNDALPYEKDAVIRWVKNNLGIK